MEFVARATRRNGINFSLDALRGVPLMPNARLSGAALQIMMIIGQLPEKDGWREISLDELAESSGRHRSTIKRSLKLLKDGGYLITDPTLTRGWHRKQRYQVVQNHES